MTRRVPLLILSLAVVLFVLAGAVMARVGGDRETYRFLSVFGDALQLMRSHYVEQVGDDELLEGAFEGMVSGLDGFSAYLTAEERAELERPVPPGTAGLVVLPSGGGVVVTGVFPGSPASEAGIRPGDQIWAIDGQSARGMALAQVIRRLSGAAGDKRVLSLLDGRSFSRRQVEVVLTRERTPGATVRMEAGGVALLDVTDLSVLDLDGLARELRYAEEKGSRILLVDLRGVGSAAPSEAASLLSVLVDGGPAVTILGRDGQRTTTEIAPGRAAWTGPVRVLMDRTTARGGEIVAAALRDRRQAVLSGETTYGQGSLQELLGFEDGTGILLSTRSLTSPAGRAWNGVGLEPDETIEQDPAARRGEGDDVQLERALEWAREALRLPAAA